MRSLIKRVFSWFKRKPKGKVQTPYQRVVGLSFEQIKGMPESECKSLCSDLWRKSGVRLAGSHIFGPKQNDPYKKRLVILNGFLKSLSSKTSVAR